MQALHKWNGVRLEIAKYCRDNLVSKEDFRFLGIYEWENVYDKVLEHHEFELRGKLYGLCNKL